MSVAGSAVLNLETLWKQSLSEVTADIDSPAQRRWLRETRPVGYNDDTVVLAAPHSFARQWLDSHCGDLLRTALSRSADRSLDVVITVQPNPAPVDPELAHATDHVQHPDTATGPSASSPPPQRGPLTSPSPQPPDGPSDAQPSPGTHAGGPMATSPQPPTDRGDPPDSPEADLVDPQAEPEAEDRDEPGVQPSADRISAVAERFPEVDPVTERTLGDTSRHGETTGEATTPAVRQPLQAPGRPPGPRARLPETKPADGHDETRLNPKYVFDHFVTGASNRFAHAAAFAVAEAPARAYNPLFIYGGAGLGKTHLLHAIGHYVRSLYPRLVARYLTTEQFTNEFINAIRDDSVVGFQRTYRRTDILLIDDIQFLENKERTQEEFFHTFNALHNAEKQIVVSSDRPPKQIARLEGRLRSRFEWGLMTDVQPPDLETRIAILKKKATYESLPVPDEVLELIASKVQSNIRELEGALIRVTAYASLQQTDVDGELAELVLKDLFPSQTPREISPSLIQEVVAEFFDFTVEELCSRSRTRRVVTARQIAMFLVRELTDLSLPRIGKVFGDRDHTTVMHARDKIQGLMKERQAIYDQVQELTTLIRNQACT